MRNIYLYPITSRNFTGISNPYISFLGKALSENYRVINLKKPSDKGILDLIKYLGEVDILYLNWIEDLPEKHRGIPQTIIFFFLLFYLKISGKKIIWTLHNKKSHSEKLGFFKNSIFTTLLKKSDLIITHSKEGLKHIPAGTKSAFIHHPVKVMKNETRKINENKYDIIIWGTIAKYKAIDAFLTFLEERGILKKYNIMIAGKVRDNGLLKYLNRIVNENENIHLINKFVEEEELRELISISRIILFSYHSESVLSSGALMDSLNYPAAIVGPNTGAFKDLKEEGLLYTFKDYDELIGIIDHIISNTEEIGARSDNIKSFIMNNTWDDFSVKIYNTIEKKLVNS